MKTKVEIINETIEYYSKDPNNTRGMMYSSCTYLTSDGKMCAFGRVMKPEIREEYRNNINQTVQDLNDQYSNLENTKGLDSILMDDYKGHDLKFWKDIQFFHDESNHWSIIDNKITGNGEEFIEYLLKQYAD